MMRRILVALAIVTVILTGCSKPDKSYVSMKVDGKSYRSTVMTDSDRSISSSNQSLDLRYGGFSFRYYDVMTSSDGPEICLLLRFSSSDAYQLGTRYKLPNGSAYEDNYDTAFVRMTVDGQVRYYYVIDGWVCLDNVESYYHDAEGAEEYRVSGSFSFTAKDEFSGDVIEVTDGELHSLMML